VPPAETEAAQVRPEVLAIVCLLLLSPAGQLGAPEALSIKLQLLSKSLKPSLLFRMAPVNIKSAPKFKTSSADARANIMKLFLKKACVSG